VWRPFSSKKDVIRKNSLESNVGLHNRRLHIVFVKKKIGANNILYLGCWKIVFFSAFKMVPNFLSFLLEISVVWASVYAFCFSSISKKFINTLTGSIPTWMNVVSSETVLCGKVKPWGPESFFDSSQEPEFYASQIFFQLWEIFAQDFEV
jgi:hypothetical protein